MDEGKQLKLYPNKLEVLLMDGFWTWKGDKWSVKEAVHSIWKDKYIFCEYSSFSLGAQVTLVNKNVSPGLPAMTIPWQKESVTVVHTVVTSHLSFLEVFIFPSKLKHKAYLVPWGWKDLKNISSFLACLRKPEFQICKKFY